MDSDSKVLVALFASVAFAVVGICFAIALAQFAPSAYRIPTEGLIEVEYHEDGHLKRVVYDKAK